MRRAVNETVAAENEIIAGGERHRVNFAGHPPRAYSPATGRIPIAVNY